MRRAVSSRSWRLTTRRKRARWRRAAGRASAAAFESRQVEQVLHDALEPPGLTLDGFEIALARRRVGLHFRHPQRLEIPAHRRQRRAQFVARRRPASGGAVSDGAQGFVARRQIAGHAIEGLRHPRDLVAAGVRRARGEVAAAQPDRSVLERGQAPARRAGRSPASPAASRQRAPVCPAATACRPTSRENPPIGGGGMTTIARNSPATCTGAVMTGPLGSDPPRSALGSTPARPSSPAPTVVSRRPVADWCCR